MQSTSGQQDYSSAETVLGVAAAGQSVMGMPSDMSHVLHPDGRKTPAMFVEVSADCKVSPRHAACGMHSSLCWSFRHTCCHLQVVLVVVRSLHMSPGKIGAQCAHAAVGLYKVIVTNRAPWLSAWEVGFFATISHCDLSLTISDRNTNAAMQPQVHEHSGDMMLLQYRALVRRQ